MIGFRTIHKDARVLSVAVLLANGLAVCGQSALDGFDPHANDRIYAVAVRLDGKIVIGGAFTTLAPNGGAVVTRNHIARLNADGSLDTNFNANANGIVYALAVPWGGSIVAGGDFTSIGGQPRKFIARLDGATGAALSFDANANSGVRAIALQSDGRILVGGLFNGANSIGGQTRNYIARLDATTGLADSFNPNASDYVLSIQVQADGRILAGGAFGSIGGQPRSYIARVDANTGLADAFNPNANNTIYSTAVQADGKVLAAGNFTSIGGAARRSIARLDATTGLADAFDPKANNDLRAILVQPDGKVLAGGYFTTLSPNGGTAVARGGLARLNPDGTLDITFDPNANSDVQSLAVQADRKILAVGSFTTLAPSGGAAVARSYIARLETDGRLDRTLDLGMVGSFVWAIAVQPDGKALIGGSFTSIAGVARTNIARLHTDGAIDLAFNPNANGAIESIAVQADGRILVGGEFNGANSIAGATRNYIARLNADGTIDAAFNPNADGLVLTLAFQADGRILAGGTFSNIGGLPRHYLARLEATNGSADSFDPNPDSTILSIAVQTDGEILAGGYFTSIGGLPRNYIARLDAATGIADAFNPSASGTVGSIVEYPHVGIIVGGSFTNIGGAPRHHIAWLNLSDGSANAGFDRNADGLVLSLAMEPGGRLFVGGQFSNIGGQPRNRIARTLFFNDWVDSFDPNASDGVNSLAIQADTKILAGGSFTNIGGQPRNLFARLNNDRALVYEFTTQSLEVREGAVIWHLLDTGPHFTRVTFEYSTDHVNYTLLGNGAFAGLYPEWEWILEQLSFPIRQNFYVRARGYYGSGLLNASGSIMEYVQNFFLVPIPPLLNIRLSPNTNVVLSWVATGFTLEASTNLNTNAWSVVSPAPVVSGATYAVTNAVSGQTRFYRLRQ